MKSLKKLKTSLCVVLIWASLPGLACGQEKGLTNTSASPYVKLRSVDMDAVKWQGGFWGDKFDVCHRTMIPYMREIYMERALRNFKIAAGLEEGDFWGPWWGDGDFYKWLEAMTFVQGMTGDAEFSRQMDEIIDLIGKAQAEDGYISTPIQIGRGIFAGSFTYEAPFSEAERWSGGGQHEVYNFGHMFTAACVHHRLTGKRTFLDIAIKAADNMCLAYSEPTPRLMRVNSTPSQYMGLVELYRTTGDEKYLELAETFVDIRGMFEGGSNQNQNRIPVREADEAVGHAVRVNYLYAGVADLYAETGEEALWDALERMWHDVTYRKMYITGATGALHQGVNFTYKGWPSDRVGEAYGRSYELPNASAYNETCANIANGMWNWRMLSLTGEVRFADVMEQVFYNSGISGIGLSGKDFYYTNVLRWNGEDHRLLGNDAHQRWDLPRNAVCCPTNVVRTIAQMSNYAYSLSDEGLWVNLYGGNHIDTELPDGSEIELSQETDYPWGGDIKITVQKTPRREWSLFLRIPEWATGSNIKVNQKVIDQDLGAGEYYQVKRKWSKGDVVQLHLPLEVRLMEANPLVEETRNQLAVMRGPLVYCLESVDLPEEVKVSEIKIPDDIRLTPRHDKDLLGGVTVLEGQALRFKGGDWSNRLYRQYDASKPENITIKMIPYYAWSNRGLTEMSIWLEKGFQMNKAH